MGLKYAIHQVDGNAEALYDYLRAHGAQVDIIGRPLDALVHLHGITAVVEVKTPKGKLRDGQKAYLANCRGLARVLRTDDDCAELLADMRELAEMP